MATTPRRKPLKIESIREDPNVADQLIAALKRIEEGFAGILESLEAIDRKVDARGAPMPARVEKIADHNRQYGANVQPAAPDTQPRAESRDLSTTAWFPPAPPEPKP